MPSYESTDSKAQPLVIKVDAVETQVRSFLLGKVLTVIDASYTDREQREAVKSLIKQIVDDQMRHIISLHEK